MAVFESSHDLGDLVLLDKELEGRVLAVRFYTGEWPEYLIGWFSNGDAKSEWVTHWRVHFREK